MFTKEQCEPYVGKWVHFRTQYGYHVGLVERVNKDGAVILSPRQYIPSELTSSRVTADEMKKVNPSLAWWGGMGGGYPGGGYGAGAGAPGAGGFGGRGYAGYGGWGWGWGRWAVSFLIIYVLWGLLW